MMMKRSFGLAKSPTYRPAVAAAVASGMGEPGSLVEERDVELQSLFLGFERIASRCGARAKFEALDHLLTETGWRTINSGDHEERFLEYSALGRMLQAPSISWLELPDRDPLSAEFLKAKSLSARHFTPDQYTREISDNFYTSRSGKSTARLWGCLHSNALSFKMILQAELSEVFGGQALDFCRADAIAREFIDDKNGGHWRFLSLGDASWSIDASRGFGGRSTFDMSLSVMKFGEKRRSGSKWKLPELFMSISQDDCNP
jgi:hypothetical protein